MTVSMPRHRSAHAPAFQRPGEPEDRTVVALAALLQLRERQHARVEAALQRALRASRRREDQVREAGRRAVDRAAAWSKEAHRLRGELEAVRDERDVHRGRADRLEDALDTPWWAVMKRRARIAEARWDARQRPG